MPRAALVALVFAACTAGSAEAQTLVHFQSPSGNINCLVFTSGAECVVKKQSWPRLPPRPASCDLDWVPANVSLSGTRLFVGACRGDVGPLCYRGSGCRTLRYGRAITVGRIRCVSATNGVTCRRTDGRRVGFRIAREGYRLYR
ncbi:MAG TPA: DUF6636 domain-containing protein [Gaiellaceae bacterium]|jgi:hypothetical protein